MVFFSSEIAASFSQWHSVLSAMLKLSPKLHPQDLCCGTGLYTPCIPQAMGTWHAAMTTMMLSTYRTVSICEREKLYTRVSSAVTYVSIKVATAESTGKSLPHRCYFFPSQLQHASGAAQGTPAAKRGMRTREIGHDVQGLAGPCLGEGLQKDCSVLANGTRSASIKRHSPTPEHFSAKNASHPIHIHPSCRRPRSTSHKTRPHA